MKKFNFIYLLLAFVGVVAMTSCEHPYADYTPGAKESNTGVYFPNTAALTVAADATSVDVIVARTNTADAAEVGLRVHIDETYAEMFSVPSTVKFEAGAEEAPLTISFDASTLEMGKKYAINIQLDPAEATAYAVSEYVFNIVVPEPWISLGEGIYFDDFIVQVLQGGSEYAGVGTYVEFERHETDENRVRVVNPFGQSTIAGLLGGLPTWMTFLAGDETTYWEFDISDPNDVKIADGLAFTYEDGSLAFMAYPTYLNVDGMDLYLTIWGEGNFIVNQNGIIKFPTKNCMLSGFQGDSYVGDFAQANKSGYMQYYLPGVEFVNYEMTAKYAGMTVGADNATTSAILNFGVGSDVESFKFAVVAGNVSDATAVIEGIVAGSDEYTIYDGDIETLDYTIPVEGAGMKTVVVVPYAGGEAKVDYAYVYPFYFPGVTGETPEAEITLLWDSVATVTSNPDHEAEYPSDKFVALGVVANAEELRSIKLYFNTAANIEASGLTDAQIVAEYGEDATADVRAGLEAKGSIVVGPYQFNPGDTAVAIVEFVSVYSETPSYTRLEYLMQAPAAQSARALRTVDPQHSICNLPCVSLR